jgi:hypothetical protein
MAANTILDWILGGVAFGILIGGMLMLFSGVKGMSDKL